MWKYHFVYKTTCLVTNKYYIGIHSTNSINDNYLGSGKLLRECVKEHEFKKHIREIMMFALTREDLYNLEVEHITPVINDPLNMNLSRGGWAWPLDCVMKSNETMRVLRTTDAGWVSAYHQARSTSIRKAYQEGRLISAFTNPDIQRENRRRAALPEANAKRKATMKVKQHAKGKKNSQWGTRLMNNGQQVIKVKRDDVDKYLAQNFIFGRKL